VLLLLLLLLLVLDDVVVFEDDDDRSSLKLFKNFVGTGESLERNLQQNKQIQ
jgi:hypothetical protein